MTAVAKLSRLTNLRLADTSIDDVGIGELACLDRLEELDSAGTRATDACLEKLAGITSLRTLDFMNARDGCRGRPLAADQEH